MMKMMNGVNTKKSIHMSAIMAPMHKMKWGTAMMT